MMYHFWMTSLWFWQCWKMIQQTVFYHQLAKKKNSVLPMMLLSYSQPRNFLITPRTMEIALTRNSKHKDECIVLYLFSSVFCYVVTFGQVLACSKEINSSKSSQEQCECPTWLNKLHFTYTLQMEPINYSEVLKFLPKRLKRRLLNTTA
jgi:hypothetical protein